MSRAIIKLKDGTHINIPSDCIDLRDDFILAWDGECLVAIVRVDDVSVCYLSEKKEG